MKLTIICSLCKKEKPTRHHRGVKTKIVCSDCIIKKRAEHREFLKRDVLGIRKRKDILKACKERKKIEVNIASILPRIPHLFSISKIERQILYKKYVSNGMSFDEADAKVKLTLAYLKNLMINLRSKIKSEKKLNIRFKEEFAKLLEENNGN